MEKLFEKYALSEVVVHDKSLAQCISLEGKLHSFGREEKKQIGKKGRNIIERLINKLMRGGTGEKTGGKVIRTKGKLQGKKSKVRRIVEEAFDIISKKTKKNPVQLLVDTLENSAPKEDVTRVTYGGVSYQIAVDISATRRLNLALRNVTLAAIMRAFKNKKTLAQALAEEIEYAANNDAQNSYAIKKKNDIERMAKSAR